METETFYLVCFDSSQKAIYTERQLGKQIDGLRLVPIPPEIHANCGLGLRIATELFDAVKDGVLEEDIYIVKKEGNKRNVQKWEKE